MTASSSSMSRSASEGARQLASIKSLRVVLEEDHLPLMWTAVVRATYRRGSPRSIIIQGSVRDLPHAGTPLVSRRRPRGPRPSRSPGPASAPPGRASGAVPRRRDPVPRLILPSRQTSAGRTTHPARCQAAARASARPADINPALDEFAPYSKDVTVVDHTDGHALAPAPILPPSKAGAHVLPHLPQGGTNTIAPNL